MQGRKINYIITDVEKDFLHTTISYLIANDDVESLEKLLREKPELFDEASDAYLLLKRMRIEHIGLNSKMIEQEWNAFEKLLVQKKQDSPITTITKKRYFLTSFHRLALALTLILIFSSTWFAIRFHQNNENNKQLELMAKLDGLVIDVDSIVIGMGNMTKNVDNNQTINQTDRGDLVVHSDKKSETIEAASEMIEVVVPYNRRTSIVFNEGTVAWLNSGTKIIYPKLFDRNKREIYVEGEIYLSVTKNESSPFIVHTKDFDVKVLGTSFNISSYQEENLKSIVLEEGAVEVNMNKNKISLSPNQALFVQDGMPSVKEVDTYEYTAWRMGVMIVKSKPLREIVKSISRAYRVEVECLNNVEDELYRGKLDLNKPIESLLGDIALVGGFKVSKENNSKYIIMKN